MTLEKKLPADSQLKSDYLAARGKSPIPNERWETAFTRIGKCINAVRLLLNKVSHYGDTTRTHTLGFRSVDLSPEKVAAQPSGHPLPPPPPPTVPRAITQVVTRPLVVPQPTKPVALQKRSSTEAPVALLPQPPCRSCGHSNHQLQNCPVLFYSDANNELHQEWKISKIGKLWDEYGFKAYDNDTVLPGHETRYLNRPASEFLQSMTEKNDFKRTRFEEGQPRTKPQVSDKQHAEQRRKKQGKQLTLTESLTSAISNIDIDTNFLPVLVSIHQQKSLPAPILTNHKDLPEHFVNAKALLDTGSLPGDFISESLVQQLEGDPFVYTSSPSITVCSGLDSKCYIKNKVIDINLTFVTSSLIIKTLLLTLRIISSSVDIILGRQTIKNFNFFLMTPFELGMPTVDNSAQRLIILKSAESSIGGLSDSSGDGIISHSDANANSYRKGSLINCSGDGCLWHTQFPGITAICDVCTYVSNRRGGIKTTLFRPSDRMNIQKATSVETQSGINILSDEIYDENHNTRSPLLFDESPMEVPPVGQWYTLNHISDENVRVRTLPPVDKPSGIRLSIDEIDNEKTDTFFPFLSPKTSTEVPPLGPESFLSQIQFEGDTDLLLRLRYLCLKYADIFSDKLPAKPARLPPFVIRADRKKWANPRNRTPVRLQTSRKEQEIKKHIDEMLLSGVIEESEAVYYSHPVIVQKTADSYRFCVDYRHLNECTEAASWPLPNIRGLFERIGHQKPDIFGVMDLTSGYHQAPLDWASKVLTAFICFYGIFQFTRLPFGPRRAPSYFQEMMATVVLVGLIYISCEMYLDDCIVYGRGNDEFLERLELVFQRFRRYGLYLKAKKCKFGMKLIDYVGRVISAEGISMSKQKIESVIKFPKPTTEKALQSLLGLANYFRSFVPFHTDIVAPLQRMLVPLGKRKAPLVWTEEAYNAFFKIKQAISKCPLLHFVDEISPIELFTDASDYGIGGMLIQIVGGVSNPISFVSKSLNSSQVKWSTIQKEAYAIYYCCKQLDPLLRDRKFTIHTDHKNLTFLNQDPSAMVNRWAMALQELDYTVHFVAGDRNTIADALSRLCPNLTELVIENIQQLTEVEQSSTISALYEIQPVTELQLEALEMCHNSMVGHGGLDRTIEKLKSIDAVWDDMISHTRDFIRKCACCQKMSVVKIPVHIHRYTTSTYRPFDTVNIDFVGPFPDNGYVLVMICSFTRWTELYWCANNTANAACECLLQFFGRFGAPSMIRSDRGSHFMNEIIRDFLKRTGTPHNLTLAYSKQENAIVERVNKEVNRHLRAFTFDAANLDAYKLCLPFVQRILNSEVHSSTGASPASLLFGNQLNLNRGILTVNPLPTDVPTSSSKIIADMLLIQEQLNSTAVTLLQEADAAHIARAGEPPTLFKVGSYVLVLYPKGPPSRVHTIWQGPFKVVKFLKDQYTLLNLITKETRDIHSRRLKQFLFDPSSNSPTDTARRDYMEFFIEEIIAHRGLRSKPSQMTFLVKWLNYDENHNSWEPYKSLRRSNRLHDYLRENNMITVIPKEFRNKNPSQEEEDP